MTTKTKVVITEQDTATNPDKPIPSVLRAKAQIHWHTVWENADPAETPFIALLV